MKFVTLFKIVSILFALIIINQPLKSATTGSFDITVNIVTGSRMLSFYVPTNYDSTKKYKLMVCLHGSGQPSNSYRDNLCPAWASFITNTIFVCPEGGGTAGDFYNQNGDQTIIDSAISYSLRNYNIDVQQIILEGFSLGGRSALKYGLDFPDKFKGLLLNTPAVQSQLDAKNDPNYSLHYNYLNGTKLPIAITHGATDQGYYFIVDTVFKILTDYNAQVIFTRVAGLGHNIPNNTVTQACLDFINNPLKNNLDADVTKILHPARIYEQTFKPSFRLRNRGTTNLTSAVITYSINGTTANYNWSGSLSTFEHADVVLPDITCAENANTLIVTIDSINGAYANSSLSVKQYTTQFQSLTQSIALPIKFGFELTEPTTNLWALQNCGGMMSWGVYNSIVTTEGANALMMYNTPFFNINHGLSEDNLSPLVDLTSVSTPYLIFDVCFSYMALTTAGGYNQNYTFSDTLKVLMTTDSGKTYTTIYSKAGADLATVAPITNPATLNDCVFVPTSLSQWRTEIIDLKDYKDKSKVAFVWKDVSGMGGTLWLDNIRITYTTDVPNDEITSSLSTFISPNPAIDFINIKVPENSSIINIYDIITGTLEYTQKINPGTTDMQISTSQFASGTYLLEIVQDNKSIKDKFIILK